ncbi:MAG TPA: efflux RND transporter periplasmic adaptor subunit [Candidatus Obscuribacterales bacterium]
MKGHLISTKHTGRKGRAPSSGRAVLTVLVVISSVFGALLALGVFPRIMNRAELKRMADKTVSALPVVHTVSAKLAPYEESGTLPGNIGAIQYTTIYARVDGYLKRRLVDIGDEVKAGQLLAEIDTPTIDQELAQAKADLAQAQAQLVSAEANLREAKAKDVAAEAEVEKTKADQVYAAVTARRWENMAARGAVSLQSRDERVRAYEAQTAQLQASIAEKKAADQAVEAAQSQVHVARATVAARLANVKRIEAQQAFKYVRAPFDGVITLRKVDPGALITAGSQSSSLELFQLAKIDRLRIYVNVPQTFARYLNPGQKAEIHVPEYPERTFTGVVSNVAGALDPETRTRQTEVRIDNKDHALLPGMYAQVQITTRRADTWVRVPSTTLVPRPDGMYVVTVNDGKAHYQKVAIGRDFGDEVELRAGIAQGDTIVVSPPVDLREGEAVSARPLSSS